MSFTTPDGWRVNPASVLGTAVHHTQRTVEEIKDFNDLTRMIEANLAEMNFDDPKQKSREVVKKLHEVQQKYNGKKICLSFKTKRVEFLDHDTNICVDYIKEETKREMMENKIIMKDIETERFNKAVKYAKKEKEEIFFLSIAVYEYRMANWNEFFTQVDEWVEKLDDVKLLKENIRSWKWGKQKYYRLTFTSVNFTCVSRTEFAFGHLINGLTYVVKKEDFKKHKKELYGKINNTETWD